MVRTDRTRIPSAPTRGALPRPRLWAKARRLNLALQGGGAHGAFTWGVLDRLLHEDRLEFDGVSGTSAGAVNAVALAAGLLEGGRDGARAKLAEAWHGVSEAGMPGSHLPYQFKQLPTVQLMGSTTRHAIRRMSELFSPYEFNPLDINPLRGLLNGLVDFERLRAEAPVKLFIAATELATGRPRIFREGELTADMVLASACLPTLFKAVRIDDGFYWDGGFSSNPDLATIIGETQTRDLLLVLLTPLHVPQLPKSTDGIKGAVNRLTFNQPLRSEIALLEETRRLAKTSAFPDKRRRRIARARHHLVSAQTVTAALDDNTKLNPRHGLITFLHEAGYCAAEQWLEEHGGAIGRRGTANLYAEFFQTRYLAV